MANTVFIVYNTAGQPIAAIQPNTLNGPGGVQQSSDLAMFGLGYPTWGQASDQNDYRLLENFACPESLVTPGTPATSAELGAGNGINEPVIGQLWFNTTTQSLHVLTELTGWDPVSIETSVGPSPPPSPTTGQLWYDTTVPQLKVFDVTWNSVAVRYLPLTGGALSGNLNMGNNSVTNASAVSATTVQSSAYQAANANTTNQITIPVSGNANTVDGPRIGPNLIIHQGNSTLVSGFLPGMVIGYHQSVAPPGWQLCDGSLITTGTLAGQYTLDMRNRFVIGGTTGSPVGNYVAGTYLPNMSGNGVAYGGVTLNIVTSFISDHSHSGNTQGHTLTIAETPTHVHPLRVCINGSGNTHNFQNAAGIAGDTDTQAYWTKNLNNTGSDLMQSSGSGLAHTHPISPDGGHQHTATPAWSTSLPPTVGLFFIMKI